MKKNGLKTIETYHPLYLRFFLLNARSDSHNMKKVLFDVLEAGGLFRNDKFILDCTQEVSLDKKNPRVEIIVPLY